MIWFSFGVITLILTAVFIWATSLPTPEEKLCADTVYWRERVEIAHQANQLDQQIARYYEFCGER